MVYSNIVTGEPCLIEIGDNSVISTEVCFVTHDYSIHNVIPDKANLFGKIKIGNNCFIGERATILYGTEICDNVIVAAGSVVANSISENNVIVGGNPAHIISTWEKFEEKSKGFAVNIGDARKVLNEMPEKLVQRGSLKNKN